MRGISLKRDGIFLILICSLCFTSLEAKEIKVFLFAGQSNMEGADTKIQDIDKHPPFKGYGKVQKDVPYSYQLGATAKSKTWTTLQPANNMYGPELSFARTFKKYNKDKIAIIKDAWGGTTLVSDWSPDGGESQSKKLYDRFMKHTKERLAELKAKKKKYKIEALMWHQGENDMFHRKGKKQYERNLKHFIARIRKDLNVPNLKVFIGEISTKGVWGMDNRHNVALIRDAQVAVAYQDEFVTYVPTSHFGFKVGQPVGLHYHFGTLGQLQHGVAYAEAYLKSIGQEIPREERIFKKNKLPLSKSVQLFILGGQRNMEGEEAYVAELKKLSKYRKLAKDQDVLFQYSMGGVFESKTWEPLGPTGYLHNFGPELSLGAALKKQMKSKTSLAIYKFTRSNSQGSDWLPQGSREKYRDIYQDWIAGIKRCRDDFKKRGVQCEIPAVFWHAGENDRALNWMADKYAERLKILIESTRKELDLPNLKWVITEQPMLTSSFTKHDKFYDVNKDLMALAKSDPNIIFVRTVHLPHRPVLFGTEGILKLGEEMAKAWKKFKD